MLFAAISTPTTWCPGEEVDTVARMGAAPMEFVPPTTDCNVGHIVVGASSIEPSGLVRAKPGYFIEGSEMRSAFPM